MRPELLWISEPALEFGLKQQAHDPRDGLTLFGPLEEGHPYGIRAAIIGTRDGVRKMIKWAEGIQRAISSARWERARPMFPGFEAVFRVKWDPKPVLNRNVDANEIDKAVRLDDPHQRVYKTASIYEREILNALNEDPSPDLWFVIIPDEVYMYCHPKSRVEADRRIPADYRLSLEYARERQIYGPFLPGDEELARPYLYAVDFHNQLKARMLEHRILTQIVRESTLAPDEYLTDDGRPRRRGMDVMESAIAWNIASTAFYKAGGRPWKIAQIREGVCYVGLAFKVDPKDPSGRSAGCGAQMFLDSGDGVVFRGALGPWFNPRRGNFHLSEDAAYELGAKVIRAYVEKHGTPPKELFLHGRVRFSDREWSGFSRAVPRETRLVGVVIRDSTDLKLFRSGEMPVLRGLAYVVNDRTAYLWTKGFVPRLQTYPGREVPNPLQIEVVRGEAPIDVVLNDIMALTKLNYNACIFGDGFPVTLKFADDVGEVLTAGPLAPIPPLPFKHYI